MCDKWEWHWMNLDEWPFRAKALEVVNSSCVVDTVDDVRACALVCKVCTTAILCSMCLLMWDRHLHLLEYLICCMYLTI